MKLLKITIILIIIISLSTSITVAANSDSCNQQKACETNVNSAIGYGAVELCGNDCYICGEADGVCPEDFYSEGLQGSCAKCPDPDCTATISGYTFDADTGNPIIGAKIMSKYPFKDWAEVGTTQSPNGIYKESTMAANPIGFYATYTDYNTMDIYNSEKIETSLIRGEQKQLNFSLRTAECLADCTRGNNICDATCAGEDICTFANNNQVTSTQSAGILDGKDIGPERLLKASPNYDTCIMTRHTTTNCTGPIVIKREAISVESCYDPEDPEDPENPNSYNGDNDKDNLITKTTRVYTEDGRIAILTIVYWQGEEDK